MDGVQDQGVALCRLLQAQNSSPHTGIKIKSCMDLQILDEWIGHGCGDAAVGSFGVNEVPDRLVRRVEAQAKRARIATRPSQRNRQE